VDRRNHLGRVDDRPRCRLQVHNSTRGLERWTAGRNRAQITIVEDNPGDVLLVRKALEGKGIIFALRCFENGEDDSKTSRDRNVSNLTSSCST
jgi:hypothetical protein